MLLLLLYSYIWESQRIPQPNVYYRVEQISTEKKGTGLERLWLDSEPIGTERILQQDLARNPILFSANGSDCKIFESYTLIEPPLSGTNKMFQNCPISAFFGHLQITMKINLIHRFDCDRIQ